MRYLLLTLLSLPASISAQVFTPQGPDLPDAQTGSPYSTFVLATIPDSTVVSGTDVAGMLIQEFPPLAFFITDIQGLNYPMGIESIEFTVSDLPQGLARTCTPSACRFASGFSGSVVIAGTPTEAGQYPIEIASYTRGTIDITQLTSSLGIPGLPTSFALPQGLHTLYDTDYELLVIGPNSISELPLDPPSFVFADRMDQTLVINLLQNHQGARKVEVMDMSGRVKLTEQFSQDAVMKLDCQNLTSGIHVAIVKTSDRVEVMRFMY